MPYITDEAKKRLSDTHFPQTVGELNYLATKAAIHFIDWQKEMGNPPSYTTISAAIGALEEAAAEMRRRLLTFLEIRKIVENGDVYPKWLLDDAAIGGVK